MEIEIQGIPQSLKPAYQIRVRTAKNDLQRYKKMLKDHNTQLARSDLLGSRSGLGTPTSDEPYGSNDRTRLLAGTALLEDGSKRLQDSQRIALETEEQGADILRSLRGQREQIQNARDTVRIVLSVLPATRSLQRRRQLQRADTSIDRASGTLKKMVRRCVIPALFVVRSNLVLIGGFDFPFRMYQQRVMTGAIILILVLLIGIILWAKLFR